MFSLAVSCSLSDRNAGISCCRVNPWNPKQVAISTWAGTVEVYDTTTGDCVQVQKRQSPQLAVEWVNKGVIASGGADGILFFNDLQVGSHSGPISCLSLVGQYLISGSLSQQESTTSSFRIHLTPLFSSSLIRNSASSSASSM